MKYNNINVRLLNLNYCALTNKTVSAGKMDMPALYCNTKTFPDFLALYSEPALYRKTDQTALCFFEFDSVFDGINGLYNALQYNNVKRLNYFKERFKNVRYVITPDYSLLEDVHRIENLHRIYRSRIVGLWFSFELSAIVIPNISFCDVITCKYGLDGLEECSVVCFSTKGHMLNEREIIRLKSNIKETVDRLPLKAIIVYDVCGTNEKTLQVFEYAIERGIQIIIPDNTLKNRNSKLRQDRIERSGIIT